MNLAAADTETRPGSNRNCKSPQSHLRPRLRRQGRKLVQNMSVASVREFQLRS
jgi:hypothetical protein